MGTTNDRETPSDEDLLESWRTGDRRAGDHLVTRHLNALEAYFRSRVSRPDCEDLVQETLARLPLAIKRFESRSSFRTYMLRIASRVLADYLRCRYKRARAESFDETLAMAVEQPMAEWSLLEAERRALARACVYRLPVESLTLVERRYLQEMSSSAIAREDGIPAGTVRRRLFDARIALRRDYLEAGGAQLGVDSATDECSKPG